MNSKKKRPSVSHRQSASRPRRATRFDALAKSMAQSYAHQHTVTVNSKRRILEFEGAETDRAIVALTSALANRRTRRREIDAALLGLTSVVAKRSTTA